MSKTQSPAVKDSVFVVAPHSGNRYTVGTVTAISPTGRVQVTFDNGDMELFNEGEVKVR